jgi:hypothetical protein
VLCSGEVNLVEGLFCDLYNRISSVIDRMHIQTNKEITNTESTITLLPNITPDKKKTKITQIHSNNPNKTPQK